MKVRKLLLMAAGLSLAALASTGQAYELSRADYQALGDELPPWDHDGRLPQGEGQLYELQQIHQQIADRSLRLQISAFLLQAMERQAADPARYASMRADYATQQQSFARWRESMERRRQAILHGGGSAAAPVSTGYDDDDLNPVASEP
ncbi:hypothetical protein [Hydrocarboniphaga sp.]|uniref:hypothetical protein n=1 Tax=Hydrocarboniphaga sp. TaxID=2033016 RepID=UPI003D0C380A